jgi:hypothetical protein
MIQCVAAREPNTVARLRTDQTPDRIKQAAAGAIILYALRTYGLRENAAGAQLGVLFVLRRRRKPLKAAAAG